MPFFLNVKLSGMNQFSDWRINKKKNLFVSLKASKDEMTVSGNTAP